jgi:putative hydrolase of the HAD superfamily
MMREKMNTELKNISVLAFDADDTLWSNEPYFRRAENQFEVIIRPYVGDVEILDELYSTEMSNMPILGYGAKAFTISLVETAIRMSNGTVPNHVITSIIQVGKSLFRLPMNPIDGVVGTLQYLKSRGYRLVVATKGEHRDQLNKLHRSGLENYFDFVEVMQDKTEDEYFRLMQILNVTPEKFVMIGNSFKSDIQPVLAIGGYGIHIPFEITWKHELSDVFAHPQLIELASIIQLKTLF